MGMYTEIVVKCNVIENLPDEIDNILKYLFTNDVNDISKSDLPTHEFFKCHRWTMIGSCASYYHNPSIHRSYDGFYLFSRSDIKNYNNEINKFFDWVSPYTTAIKGECIGWSWYEENLVPNLIIKE